MARKITLTTNKVGHDCKTNGKELSPLSKKEYPFEQLVDDCYSADFETTTEKHFKKYGETHVWLSGIMRINDENDRRIATSMSEVMEQFRELAELHHPYPAQIAFHNARFDLSFVENYILGLGYNPQDNIHIRKEYKNAFSYLRNDMGITYGFEIKFGKFKSIKVTDFAKIMAAPLSEIGAALDIPKRKDLIDYHKFRREGYVPTANEVEYLWDDIIILAKAWKMVLDEEGSMKLTRSGYAMEAVKRAFEKTFKNPDLVDFKNFNRMFPPTSPQWYNFEKWTMEQYIIMKRRQKEDPSFPVMEPEEFAHFYPEIRSLGKAYTGGKVYYHPKYVNRLIAQRIVSIDATSLYPSQWCNHWYPTGEGVSFEGFYDDDPKYPLYIQNFKATFTMKKGAYPSLAKKLSVHGGQIYSDKDLKEAELSLCDVDVKMFFENYEITNFIPTGGVKFKRIWAPFKTFVDEYGQKKAYYGSEEGWNPMLRFMSKLTLNGSYGKFGQSPFLSTKDPHLDEDGVTRFVSDILPSEEMAYLPMAIWTTAYGREDLIRVNKLIGVDKVLYNDTDSIKAFCDWDSEDPEENWLLKPEIKELLLTKDYVAKYNTEFNSWEDEAHIYHFKMLRDKCYIMHIKHELRNGVEVDGIDIKAAGLTDETKAKITMYFNKDGRRKYYDERTGDIVWAYPYEVPQENHKDLYYPAFRPWEEIFDNFEFDHEYDGGLTQKQVPGGVILVECTKVLTQDMVETYLKEDGSIADIVDLYL